MSIGRKILGFVVGNVAGRAVRGGLPGKAADVAANVAVERGLDEIGLRRARRRVDGRWDQYEAADKGFRDRADEALWAIDSGASRRQAKRRLREMDRALRTADRKLNTFGEAFGDMTDAKIRKEKPLKSRIIDALLPFDIFGDKPK